MVGDSLERPFSLQASLLVEAAIKLFVGVGELLPSPAHHDPCCGKHLVEEEPTTLACPVATGSP